MFGPSTISQFVFKPKNSKWAIYFFSAQTVPITNYTSWSRSHPDEIWPPEGPLNVSITRIKRSNLILEAHWIDAGSIFPSSSHWKKKKKEKNRLKRPTPSRKGFSIAKHTCISPAKCPAKHAEGTGWALKQLTPCLNSYTFAPLKCNCLKHPFGLRLHYVTGGKLIKKKKYHCMEYKNIFKLGLKDLLGLSNVS